MLDPAVPSTPSVSVVIPAYNCAKYLPACLDSVLAQTVPPDEITVVDDGSTDGTADLLQQHYPGVKILRQANGGASAARNAGIEAAQYEFVAFGDADDLWHPRRLEHQLSTFADEPTLDLVGCVMAEVANDADCVQWPEIQQVERLEVDIRLTLRWGGAIPLPTWLVRRRVFARAGVLDTSLPVAEDLDILLRVLAAGCRAVSLRNKLYGYRRRPNSLSSVSATDYAICHYRVLQRHRPDEENGQSGLTSREYWELISPWLVLDMLSAVTHERWDDAREIASEMACAPSGLTGPTLRRAHRVAWLINSTNQPLLQKAVSRCLVIGSALTRSLRQLLAKRRFRA